MRLKRSLLLDRLTGDHAPPVVLVEAPAGYGKSWLLRKAWGPGALRLRGALGQLHDASFTHEGRIVIDDAHLLDNDDVERLVEHIEFADEDLRLFIAGRLLHDSLHEVTNLVDGIVLDSTAMAVTAGELINEFDDLERDAAEQLVDVTDGCVRTIATAIDQAGRLPSANPVALASRITRATAATALQQLDARDQATVALLARAPGIDGHFLANMTKPVVLSHLLHAGIPLRRHAMGGFEVATAAAFRSARITPELAQEFGQELVDRGRPLDAVELLLDAGEPGEASQVMTTLGESIVASVEPRALLGTLARLGALVDRDPALLLIRATAATEIGRVDEAIVDIDKAASLTDVVSPRLRRRIQVETARARLLQGRHHEARAAARNALAGIEAGEERTYARAHQILAQCDTLSNRRADLQRAAESFRIAAASWEACGEQSRARTCRRDMTWGALVPLGRYDEALAQLAQILSAIDLAEAERSWILLADGFVLVNAGRLESADDRFQRVTDLGVVQDNPRLVAAAAWGRAIVARRRGDPDRMRHWIATAENTALPHGDDVLGVPFLCDVVEMLGSLGDLDEAEVYLQRAKKSAPLYPDGVRLAEFVLSARRGKVGDVDGQLEHTAPDQRWRVLLVAAHAKAREGDLHQARQLATLFERELAALGFDNAGPLGEEREQQGLSELLDSGGSTTTSSRSPASSPAGHTASRARRVCVIGSPMLVRDNDRSLSIPPGNPQRLVGVVVAYGGSATFDVLGDAIWPGEDLEVARTRLRNVLLRLRRAAGDILVRSTTGIRLAPDVGCDLHEFERLAADALSAARTDPELAGDVAQRAVELGTGAVFADFEFDEWAVQARRRAEQKLIDLLDLLSVQAEDDGNLPLAQTLAERALQLDRYTDSRYVRLAELLTLQNRTAAAVAVLDDAAAIARELDDSGPPPHEITDRRNELLKRTAAGER